MRRSRASGVTLIEVVVASSILLVLVGLTLNILNGQVQYGHQQQTKAFGLAQVQRAYNEVELVLRSSVYEAGGVWPAKSSFCTLTGDNFAQLKLYAINKTQPYTTGVAPFLLRVTKNPSTVVGVVGANGAWLAKTDPGPGKLVVGVDPAGTGTPTQTRVIADNVSRFAVSVSRDGLLQINLELSLRTGEREKNGQPTVQKPTANGLVPISAYDKTLMQ